MILPATSSTLSVQVFFLARFFLAFFSSPVFCDFLRLGDPHLPGIPEGCTGWRVYR